MAALIPLKMSLSFQDILVVEFAVVSGRTEELDALSLSDSTARIPWIFVVRTEKIDLQFAI